MKKIHDPCTAQTYNYNPCVSCSKISKLVKPVYARLPSRDLVGQNLPQWGVAELGIYIFYM